MDYFSGNSLFAPPGINTLRETVENEFYWGDWPGTKIRDAIIDDGTLDSGNTVTDVLRPGLLLGMQFSTGHFAHWDPTATDGTQYIAGILHKPGQKMKDALGTAQNRWRSVIIQANLKPERLLVPGQASFGLSNSSYECLARQQLKDLGCVMYENPLSTSLLAATRFLGGHSIIQAVTANRTLKNYESGSWFTNRGAAGEVDFTLPATPEYGVHYRITVVEDQTVKVIAGVADTILGYNNKAADSLDISTASKKIGVTIDVVYDGTGWLAVPAGFLNSLGTSDVAANVITTTDA